MGDKRFTVDEETIDNQNSDIWNPVSSADTDRNLAVAGFVKFAILILLAMSVVLFRTFIFDRAIVSGDSMNDTLNDGSVLWTKKFDISSVKRYDIVILKNEGKNYIKRVIGLPGETVQICNGVVLINGKTLDYDYGELIKDAGIAAVGCELKENEYFVLGDNRNDSMDSRIWGAVSKKQIKGIVVFQIFPFSDFGTDNIKGR